MLRSTGACRNPGRRGQSGHCLPRRGYDTCPYNPDTDWMFGNQFNAYYRVHMQAGAWEATKIMNDTAYPARALGFVIDRTPIETPIAQVVAICDEFVKPIDWGSWPTVPRRSPRN